MDRIKKFYINLQILSLLYREKTEKEIVLMMQDIEDQIVDVQIMAVKSFCIKKGLSEENTNRILNEEWEKLPNDLQILIKDQELIDDIAFNIESLYKSYFEKNFGNLTAEQQEELINFVNAQVELIDEAGLAINEISSVQDEILKANNVLSKEELFNKLNINDEEEKVEPVKATIIEDNTESIDNLTSNTTEESNAISPQPDNLNNDTNSNKSSNVTNQLQDMGISLDDILGPSK